MIHRNYNWDGGREPDVSIMWAERQVAELCVQELASAVGITARAWWGIESGELLADKTLLAKMKSVTRLRYLAARREKP